jgi:hypothetical protein
MDALAPETGPDGQKPYTTPELAEYGRIEELTQAVDMSGAMDGGTMGINRT